jgi:hypothetical protein
VGRSKVISFGVSMEVDGGLEQMSANSEGKAKMVVETAMLIVHNRGHL